ncbi:hypothetical protein H4219_000709 [Mycoemilia scoparia]|uniref:4-hydroxyphenylpyruvate dioxygenase n=1 Tax=Mycoemilia scoparia TaxID=417184 RepID=A0A9W8DWC6_9FUNG|nr:hypothetical protein H4219_000709 [Mycoemilia scoparia]
MILLEPDSFVLKKSLLSCFTSEKRDIVDIKLVDFDNVLYHIVTPDDNNVNHLNFSMQMRCFNEAMGYGAGDVLQRIYGNYIDPNTAQGYNVTLRFDLDQLPEDAEGLAQRVSEVKRMIISAPFEQAIQYWESKPEQPGPLMALPYRENETLYVQAHVDRITVIFSVLFKEEMDQVFGKVFLQEFVDVRRQGVLPNAPQVLYSSRDPPLEIRDVVKFTPGENRGFVTFILTPRHFADLEVREKTISQIPLFRDYLQYHIKCAKAYMHSRMRTRVSDFLKVLNRAKPDHSAIHSEKRTVREMQIDDGSNGDDDGDGGEDYDLEEKSCRLSTRNIGMTSYFDKGTKPDFNYEAFDHVTWWVGNAKQAASYYCSNFGFKPLAYKGLETGERNVVSHVVYNNKAVFQFQSALKPGNKEFTEFIGQHGDGVKNVAFSVDDARACFQMAVDGGAAAVKEPWEEEDEHGKVVMATVSVYGDTDHTFVQRQGYRGIFLPGYRQGTSNRAFEILENVPVNYIDHCVSNQPSDMMAEVCKRYERMLGFHRFWSVDDKEVCTDYSSLRSVVMAEYNEKVKMPINEPAPGKGKSQIDEYIEFYGGPGIQHIAINTPDVIEAVRHMRERGAEFLRTPHTYYESLRERLKTSLVDIKEDLAVLEELGILVDYDDNGYLLQIFTRPLQDRPTLFLEFIQRNNHQGFGQGNFKALFEAIEREQADRGNL